MCTFKIQKCLLAKNYNIKSQTNDSAHFNSFNQPIQINIFKRKHEQQKNLPIFRRARQSTGGAVLPGEASVTDNPETQTRNQTLNLEQT